MGVGLLRYFAGQEVNRTKSPTIEKQSEAETTSADDDSPPVRYSFIPSDYTDSSSPSLGLISDRLSTDIELSAHELGHRHPAFSSQHVIDGGAPHIQFAGDCQHGLSFAMRRQDV